MHSPGAAGCRARLLRGVLLGRTRQPCAHWGGGGGGDLSQQRTLPLPRGSSPIYSLHSGAVPNLSEPPLAPWRGLQGAFPRVLHPQHPSPAGGRQPRRGAQAEGATGARVYPAVRLPLGPPLQTCTHLQALARGCGGPDRERPGAAPALPVAARPPPPRSVPPRARLSRPRSALAAAPAPAPASRGPMAGAVRPRPPGSAEGR